MIQLVCRISPIWPELNDFFDFRFSGLLRWLNVMGKESSGLLDPPLR